MNIISFFLGKGVPTLLGWIGTFAYLIAYLLLSTGRLKAEKKLYHILNILGAIGLTYNAIALSDYPNVMVNIVWAVIALWAILLIQRKKQN